MRVYTSRGLGDIYYNLIRDITEHGRKVNIRGNDCLELPDRVCLEYTAPGHCWMRIPGRKFNPFLALAEVLWILSGSGNAEWIIYFGSNLKSFLDEGHKDFWGAYGKRIRKWERYTGEEWIPHDQFYMAVGKLQKETTSRQAVISLWDPLKDNIDSRGWISKDVPCNNLVYYELRDGRLNQTVVIRSNDVVWGTPYNAVQFSHIHAYVAGLLSVKIGTLTYVIQNLHYYLDLYKPTLSNLIDRAYDANNYNNICAESVEGFAPFGDWELLCLKKDVECTLKIHKDNADWSIERPVWGGYTKKIADMLRLYTMVKSRSVMVNSDFERLAELEQPWRGLVIDFYEGSTNPHAQHVVDFLRRNNDVCA